MMPLNPAERAGQGPTLIDLIRNAAESTSQSIIAYGAEETVGDLVPTVVSYSDLLCLARTNAQVLLRLCPPSVGIGGEHHVDLLCLDNILDTIIWFWSTAIAGLLPAISTTSILEPGRSEYLSYLPILLKDPLCIVPQSLSGSYCLQDFAKKLPVAKTTSQSLARMSQSMPLLPLSDSSSASDPAVLMLTSGTTGRAKAVQLSHDQILASLEGKAKSAGPHSGGPYLNWIVMDHVACLTEIHLLAMYMGFSQVHLSADEVLSNPVQLLNMVSRHRVSRTFAPHSFLAKLSRELMLKQTSSSDGGLDLGCLQWLGSSGEANTVGFCEALQTQLEDYGARKDIIIPGVPGLQLRVRLLDGNSPSAFANAGQVGLLELSGDVVFDGYFNDRDSNAAAFTRRSKDTIIINGVKYAPDELEHHLEKELIQGADIDTRARTKTRNRIVDIIGLHTASSAIVLPLTAADLKPSARGKLPKRSISKSRGPHHSIKRSIFWLGATSMDLIKIARLISDWLQLLEGLTPSQVLKSPTPRRLAMINEGSERKDEVGSPVLTLRSKGKKTPLWLVHPGVGEILVFMNLIGSSTTGQSMPSVQGHFEAVQAKGPYAIAGYPFGSMIAFELCKRLETAGDEVLYCGCWNLPPHIKHRIRQFGWVECLANSFHFTKLIEQDQALQQIPMLRTFSKQEAVAHLRAPSDSDRPRGTIRSMDVFVADPLKEVAIDRKDWVLNKLSRWREFVSDVQCYDVPGEHYSMSDEVNVSRFAEKLKEVLEAREGPLRRTLHAASRSHNLRFLQRAGLVAGGSEILYQYRPGSESCFRSVNGG
ncbi:hypothetical protein CTAM01_13243 [Colletotrichum tamarilloi]|uniref:AMP-dependent synthetase/ligase domain-containing protein n=1 Tax=Colletotrichum tamarilloi TaxID=1209934 RepID=A0ABQ9QSN4_9PEZI|nr:uncharacterized protein CTAM01_13243 [Colletotrichum tamarilloi]KAK1483872.1 hypothetical protein CTAM01_13243 [Colletotrichum tamarilloi]